MSESDEERSWLATDARLLKELNTQPTEEHGHNRWRTIPDYPKLLEYRARGAGEIEKD